MTLFIIFIFGAVMIGAGAMLSPAWRTREPRIGLAAALALGVVMGGSLFWAMLFGWNTLVVDYLLFALVTSIFLFGTLSYGQKRAEARGEILEDRDQGWSSGRDLLLFTVAALVFVVPALTLPVPLDTDAQGFGYLALMARLGGDFRSLAPFQPEITYLYAPGFSALAAYLSGQLGLGLHQVQQAVAAVLCLMLVLLAYDFGAEYRDKRLGRACALAMLIGIGLFTAYMDSHYTTLLALVFAFAFLIFIWRYVRDGWLPDAIAAGLMLGAVALAHPNTTIILALGYAPWLLTMWLGKPRPILRRWLVLSFGVPLIALAGIAPWLLSIRDLLSSDITSPFPRLIEYASVMILNHGIVIVPIALVGALVGLRKRDPMALLCVVWLALIFDFAAAGILESLLPGLIAPLVRYDYPFSIAWRGPIIPYAILGGMGLLWLWEHSLDRRFGAALHRAAPALLTAAVVLLLGGGVFSQELLAFSKGRVGFYGAFSSAADVEAMLWLRDHTPPQTRILNHPGPHEADWVPVIAERETVYFRPQPFFRGTERVEAEQQRMLAFWRNPADPANEALLRDANIEYVIVPQIVTDPNSIETMFRWRPPFTEWTEMQSPVDAASYLQLVFDARGARVYELTEARSTAAAQPVQP